MKSFLNAGADALIFALSALAITRALGAIIDGAPLAPQMFVVMLCGLLAVGAVAAQFRTGA